MGTWEVLSGVPFKSRHEPPRYGVLSVRCPEIPNLFTALETDFLKESSTHGWQVPPECTLPKFDSRLLRRETSSGGDHKPICGFNFRFQGLKKVPPRIAKGNTTPRDSRDGEGLGVFGFGITDNFTQKDRTWARTFSHPDTHVTDLPLDDFVALDR